MKFSNNIAIALLTTEKEYKDGSLIECLNYYFNDHVSKDISIDLFIYFNKGNDSQYPSIFNFSNHKNVNSLNVHYHHLSEHEDTYFRTPQSMRRIPKSRLHPLGGSGGPNLLCYKSMIRLMDSDYENILMVECDSRPIKKYWLDCLLPHLDKDFLLLGSRNKGQQQLSPYETWSGHLNGIAVYKVSPHTKHLLDQSKKLIKHQVYHNINKFISFDVGIWLFTQTFEWYKYLSDHKINFETLIDSEVISNYSLYADITLNEEDILSKHPNTIILHQKWN